MTEVILDNISFAINLSTLVRKLATEYGSTYAEDVKRMAHAAQTVARPKALYKVAFIEFRDDRTVVVDGTTLTSRVLCVNLEKAHRVFPYVATCGEELDEWSRSVDGFLYRYWADTIKEMALRSAVEALNKDLVERYQPGRTSAMNPGSLEDWPLEQQRALFQILGDPKRAIGVQLTESFLMIPTKSVSGIRFPMEESFESCQLCPRENCRERRSPYDEELYERKYRVKPN